MDIEVKNMSPEAVELLEQLSVVCRRYGISYYSASQTQRDLLDSIALHEYQLKKAHEQGQPRSVVPPFLGLKRTRRSDEMPACSAWYIENQRDVPRDRSITGNVPFILSMRFSQPGGQVISRPDRTWKCRWWTLWPACSPMLETTR